ncbi:restriction endonuclease subunit M [Clostridium sp. SL.3.18]|nr:restriction endonuclease subunit M [Clostridium sp. SL.3.18]
MQFEEKLDVIEEDIAQYCRELLDILLKDRTTNENIIWATSDYISHGEFYAATEQIYANLITGIHSKLIQPRVAKAHEQKNSRTRDKAEVFTPSWICNIQNNLVDEHWFGRPDVFNTQQNNTWTATERIVFLEDKQHTWRHYVDARRIEVSCGEAPYLVSRYDTVTGEPIELLSRIGLLDRKLRVVTENASDENEWLKWVYRAYESVYGFEFQGDNLLLARENLLYTFIDYMRYALKRTPTLNELKKVATIISWNLWQMDGLTYGPPLCDIQEEMNQLSLFDFIETETLIVQKPAQSRCKIKDWRSKVIVEYYSLVKEEG